MREALDERREEIDMLCFLEKVVASVFVKENRRTATPRTMSTTGTATPAQNGDQQNAHGVDEWADLCKDLV
ncbi:MAG: hypothetical protein ACOY3E_07105 [Pseudomonadota bacterium]